MEAATQTAVLKITNQEQKIINHCTNKSIVTWQELAQYAKDPATVKLKTIQKAISDIKKKYRDANLPSPLTCSFISLLDQKDGAAEVKQETVKPRLTLVKSLDSKSEVNEQKLVQLRITRGNNRVPADDKRPDAHIDFVLDPFYKRVRTRTNTINLSDNEWELFKLLHENVDKMLSLENIKDVVYKNFGSKTPHCWADSIKRTLTKLRTNIRELKTDNRLICSIGSNTTFYMLK